MCDTAGNVGMPFLVTTDDEIIEIVDRLQDPWVAIDASLKVPNETGLRNAERMLVREGIRVLPTNKMFLDKHCGGSRGEHLLELLIEKGFRPADDRFNERYVFETYPYAFLRTITQERVVYKKGTRKERMAGCRKVLAALVRWEPSIKLPESLFDIIEEGRERSLPDLVDSVLCVGCLYAHWLYRGERTRLVGDRTDGHILLAKRH